MSVSIKDIVSSVCCNRWCKERLLKRSLFPEYICFDIALDGYGVIKKDLLAVINQSEDVDFV